MTEKQNYQLHQKDTGSTSLQIISLRKQINQEKIHLESNKKDIPARRALLKKIAKEKRFLLYLQKRNPDIYVELKKGLK
ncbi:MAG: 30S ribosomal protein S15 [Spiroplasmataceae bacterium]|jgi:small subunit ribosomal protein S15|nr:30S ribosomal protein S15 [Spiroplasmataceae bacterium]